MLVVGMVMIIGLNDVYADDDPDKWEGHEPYDLTEPEEYPLKGQSEHVRVMINSGDVKLYLADGLNLNCSSTTYVGSRTSAINVDVEIHGGGGEFGGAGIGTRYNEDTGTII